MACWFKRRPTNQSVLLILLIFIDGDIVDTKSFIPMSFSPQMKRTVQMKRAQVIEGDLQNVKILHQERKNTKEAQSKIN